MSRIVRNTVGVLAAGAVILGLTACGEAGDAEPTTVTATVSTTAEAPTTVVPPPQPRPSPATGSPTTGSPTTPPEDLCEPAVFQRSGADYVDTVLYCDGQWARAGHAQSDQVAVFRWTEGTWTTYPWDGTSSQTGYGCYDREKMIGSGASPYILDTANFCESQES